MYGELCDWYLELVKHRLTDGEGREELRATLLHILRETLALAHPVIPFVTEELWSYVAEGELLAGADYPKTDETLIDEVAEAEVSRAIEAVTLMRAWRNSVNARPGLVVPARLNAEGYESTAAGVARLARLELSQPASRSASQQAIDNGSQAVVSVPVPGGVFEVLSDVGLDLAAEEQRRAGEREKLRKEIGRVRSKLANEGFVAKAPAPVVAGERAKLAALEKELEAAR